MQQVLRLPMHGMDRDASLEWPPAAGRQAHALWLLQHGVGGTPADLLPLARRLSRELPDALIVSQAAPDPFDGGGDGLQWFSIAGVTAENRPARVAAALPRFVRAIRDQQARHGFDWRRTVLMGFSQGALMALEAVQAEPQLAARVFAIAGRYATPPVHAPDDTVLHLLHGEDDDVVPPASVIDGAKRLAAMGAAVTLDVLPGIGHTLDAQLVERAVERLHERQGNAE